MSRSHACDPTAESPQRHGPQLHREGAVELDLGGGFFRPESRPSRDLGVLLAAWLARRGTGTLRVLDGMAGSGIRALRYGTEAGATSVWANDADPDRRPLLERNLADLSARGVELTISIRTVQALLAEALIGQERFDLIDLDAFGCPAALVPLALEAVAFDGVLYLASTDGRSPTGHDRPAAVRRLGAAARAHPASWELALRLQLGVIARAAWALGRGVQPLFSFSEGRTFRTAVRLQRRAAAGEESHLGLLALCHGCGDQQVQSLLQLRRWAPCLCRQAPAGDPTPLAISGPLWIGPLQNPDVLGAMAPGAAEAPMPPAEMTVSPLPALGTLLEPASLKLLRRLQADPAAVARCWPTAEIARRLGGGPPRLEAMIQHLRQRGHGAWASGVMAAQLRSDAPWPVLLEVARAAQAGTLLNRFGLRSSPGHGL